MKINNLTYLSVLVVLIALVFSPSINNSFLYSWDDQWMLMNQYTEGGINRNNLHKILLNFYHGQYAPLTQYLFLIIYSIYGYNPLPFHLASIALHSINTCFVYYIILHLFSQTNRTFPITMDTRIVAFSTALIFSIHPLNVESVAWISAIKVPLYSFFYLAATMLFLSFLKKGGYVYYILSFLFFILSFGAKEQAVVFPIWLVLIFWILGYNIKERWVWFKIIPFLILAVFFGIVTLLSQYTVGEGELSASYTFPIWQRITYGSYSFIEYLYKFIFPYKLLILYPFPITRTGEVPTWLLIYPSSIILILITLYHYLKKLPILFGILFFLIHIAITLHFISISRSAIIADRYIYIASIGLAFTLSYYLYVFYKKLYK